MASAQILAEEQRVYLRRVAADDHVLVVVGKNLGLNEVAAAKDCRQRACFANALQSVCAKCALVFAVSALDVVSFKKDTVLLRDAEVPRDALQAQAFELSRRDVVILSKNPDVHKMPATRGEFRILNCFFRDLQA